MFGKLMSSLGLQSVTVDTLIQNPAVYAGQVIQGEVRLSGADQPKQINGLSLQLMTIAEVESGDHEFNQPLILQQWSLAQRFELAAQQELVLPFQLELPHETPVTEVNCRRNSSRVWIHTHLDVDWGLDAKDRDYLQVHPTPVVQAFLQAMQQAGLVLNSVDVEKGQLRGRGFQSTIGCYQEFEFVPERFGSMNEVEVSFVAQPQQTHVMLEIDRKLRGDQLKTLTLPNQPLSEALLVSKIRELLF